MKKQDGYEKEIVFLEVEMSRLNRDKSLLVMNKSLVLYFFFILIAVLGYINAFISQRLLNILIVMSLCVLVIGTVPYIKTMKNEEMRLLGLMDELRKRGMKK